jgi:AcrR family transcriptional regulator
MDENPTIGLPPGIDLLWGLRKRSRRGPKPGLSLDLIVTTAITVADAEGLGPLSMSRLAEELGFTTMSLYRYVASKDELLMLMLNAAGSAVLDEQSADPPSAEKGWRPGLERWCRVALGLYHRHPWILQVPISGPPLDPGSLGWMEYGLRTMAGTGLTEAEKVNVILLLTALARHQGRLEWELAQGAKAAIEAGGPPPSYGQMLRTLLDRGRYPALYAVIDSGAFDDEEGYDSDEDFTFALARTLDGIEALIASRQPSPP